MEAGAVLVTGCAGFIGSTLVDTLLAAGRDVAGIDSFEGFYRRESKERNLSSARTSRRFRFQELDTRNAEGLAGFVSAVRPSTVVDLAARAGARDSLRDPLLYIDINVRGLQNLLSALAGVEAALVFASSSSVYGPAASLPFREDEAALRPVSPYGATKVAGEALVSAHHAIVGSPVRIARLFTVYGPRQRPDLGVYTFAERLLDGRPIPLYDRGLATRDFTYVDDVVDGLLRLIDADEPELVVNLGSGSPHSNLELLEQLERVFDKHGARELLPAQPGDVPATYADREVARRVLGWTPRMTLDEGLLRFRDWFLGARLESSQSPA
jgi:UDP-glucuronate 4-epimerase